jgi:hypothetical protein
MSKTSASLTQSQKGGRKNIKRADTIERIVQNETLEATPIRTVKVLAE